MPRVTSQVATRPAGNRLSFVRLLKSHKFFGSVQLMRVDSLPTHAFLKCMSCCRADASDIVQMPGHPGPQCAQVQASTCFVSH